MDGEYWMDRFHMNHAPFPWSGALSIRNYKRLDILCAAVLCNLLCSGLSRSLL